MAPTKQRGRFRYITMDPDEMDSSLLAPSNTSESSTLTSPLSTQPTVMTVRNMLQQRKLSSTTDISLQYNSFQNSSLDHNKPRSEQNALYNRYRKVLFSNTNVNDHDGITTSVATPKTNVNVTTARKISFEAVTNSTPSVSNLRKSTSASSYLSNSLLNASIQSARRSLDFSSNQAVAEYFTSIYEQRVLPTYKLKDDSIHLDEKVLKHFEELANGKMSSFPEYPLQDDDDSDVNLNLNILSDAEWGKTHELLIKAKCESKIPILESRRKCNIYDDKLYHDVLELIFQFKQSQVLTDNELCKKLEEHTEGIPRSTLQRWIKNYQSGAIQRKKSGRKPLLVGEDLETVLHILKICYSKNFAPDTKETADLV